MGVKLEAGSFEIGKIESIKEGEICGIDFCRTAFVQTPGDEREMIKSKGGKNMKRRLKRVTSLLLSLIHI